MIPALFAASWTFAPMQFGEALAMTVAVSIFMASWIASFAAWRIKDNSLP